MTTMRVGEIDALVDGMGDEDDGRAEFAFERHEIVVELGAGDFVERGEGFVHQQHGGARHQRARDRNAHLHAAGEFARECVGEAGEADALQRLLDARRRLSARDAGQPQRQPDIGEHRAPRHQRRLLKHEAEFRAAAAPGDRASRRRRQAGQKAQDRRFAAARRTEQRKELALAHVQIRRRPARSRHWRRPCRRRATRRASAASEVSRGDATGAIRSASDMSGVRSDWVSSI